MTSLTRRRWLGKLAGTGVSALAVAKAEGACAATDSVRWIVPNSIGGGYDSYSRLLQPYIERELGVSLRFRNLPGAGGLVGAKTLSEAEPDGSVLGIVNVPAVLMTQWSGSLVLDAVEGFTPLATIAKSGYLWATGSSSAFRSIEDVAAAGRGRGLVCGVSSLSSLDFILTCTPGTMLDWRMHYVPGYLGSAERALAAIRGEVDVVALSHEVLVGHVRAGDLRPLLAISPETRALREEFREVAALAGPGGLVQRLAPEAESSAQALVRFTEGGRVLAAPAGVDARLTQCLRESVCRAIQDPQVAREGAARNLDVQPYCAAETAQKIQAAQQDAKLLGRLVQDAVQRAQAQ